MRENIDELVSQLGLSQSGQIVEKGSLDDVTDRDSNGIPFLNLDRLSTHDIVEILRKRGFNVTTLTKKNTGNVRYLLSDVGLD